LNACESKRLEVTKEFIDLDKLSAKGTPVGSSTFSMIAMSPPSPIMLNEYIAYQKKEKLKVPINIVSSINQINEST